MEILDIKVLNGPNYWSNSRTKLIELKLHLHEYETKPTNLIEKFPEHLKQLLPSLYNHYCSENTAGGFFRRLEEGTWLGHVIEHVALELQWLAGMRCGYGRTRSTNEKGVYHVVFSYEIENAGKYAAYAAVNLVKTLAQHTPYTLLSHDLEQLKQIKMNEALGPSTQSIVQEAKKRGIPCTRLDNDSSILLGQGHYQKLMCATISSQTSILGVENAADKEKTKQLLLSAFIPVPQGLIVQTENELAHAIEKIGFPAVIKPVDGNHGRGITTNINTSEKAHSAFKLAKQSSEKIIVEKFIRGFDYRFLVINYKVVAVARRSPPMITGTGTNTIQQLIDAVNLDPNRGEHHEKFLTKIKIDEITLSILSEQGFTLESILPLGQSLYLKHAANLSTGGTAVDVTPYVHPHTVFLAERIARLMNLDICGIDILAKNISLPLKDNNGAVIEVNSCPGFRMHLAPEQGMARNVAKPILDMLFPQNQPSRIPIVAVTGTNGKTTTVRLVAHLAKEAGFCVGFTSTEGIYINHHEVSQGDCSGPHSARTVLRDPLVNFAVFECARGGILRSGLGFDKCNISIVTNISEDHLGFDDIHSLNDLARVKEVVPRSTMKDGYAILNADDDLVYQIKDVIDCHIALFSLHAHNERIHQHFQQEGLVAYLENDNIVIQKGAHRRLLANVHALPCSFQGKATFMIQNILPAVLAGVISHFKIEDMAKWLQNFHPTAENLPGRMNLYAFSNFKIMIDYGHNEAAFIQFKTYLHQNHYKRKVGIIAATGNRRPSDIRKVGYYAAQMFDEIIIRHDEDSRGRTNEELTSLILEGIREIREITAHNVKIISNEKEALHHAMNNATPGTFILYFPEDVLEATSYLKKIHKEQTEARASVI
ncbi:cyanophycin synthetase [Legionella israelensis]|uniref:Cyanophycin synthetase n=1 Tax=Legionella israelensis TaxID=454 RepID=A0A0W0WM62_9GAMM|nr:cyanophycin synthetase [Legionella israelensis]KTD33421.1 cyanophycin synthetase [Legionella israelensis]QBS09166.1 cyanophycin synthetase [Legionella israelensis]SCY29683.1 cyanophycin synthetase [Legionella israelensis DSM 19235]STX58897.1 cyanophycin synthetase [Legionella israelensis]